MNSYSRNKVILGMVHPSEARAAAPKRQEEKQEIVGVGKRRKVRMSVFLPFLAGAVLARPLYGLACNLIGSDATILVVLFGGFFVYVVFAYQKMRREEKADEEVSEN